MSKIIFKSDEMSIRRIIGKILKSKYYEQIIKNIVINENRKYAKQLFDEGYKEGFENKYEKV